MSYPFFRPPEVHAQALILVGYRLYPYTRVELHPRLTLLAGGNGAGKTTLLDSLQTILIADRRSLHLNVAAGQHDRDLGGQLQDRVAWAVLHLSGHAEVQAVGVWLSRRAASDYVDIKPFALYGTEPARELFLDRGASKVLPDIKALQANVGKGSAAATVKEFTSVNDYHRFLYEEGLLPLDLSRGGKRQFSLLWRQATQPHMGELNGFLQQILCHEPEKRLTFQDVEKFMQERLHTERQLKRIEELKEITAELRLKVQELDTHRRRCLGISLGIVQQRQEALRREIETGEKRLEDLEQQTRILKDELDAIRVKLDETGPERDKYVREQGEWSRKYQHYQEYSRYRGRLDEMHEDLYEAQEAIAPLEAHARELRSGIEQHRDEMQKASNELARMKGSESELDRQARKWLEFQKDLERAGALLGEELRSAGDLERVWLQVSEEKRNVQQSKPLKQLLDEWQGRAKAHRAATELCGKLAALWPELFHTDGSADRTRIDKALLDKAQMELRSMEKQITIRREELKKERVPLKLLIEEVSKGRMPLPASAGSLVEDGIAAPFASHFDDLALEDAREYQEAIGPFARAIEPKLPGVELSGVDTEPCAPSEQLSKLARGKEPFWVVFSPEVVKQFRILARSEQGTLSGFNGIGWYTPHSPVSIGAEARREQIGRAQEKLSEIDDELKELTVREDLIARRTRAIQDFLPKLDAYLDVDAPRKAQELSVAVGEIERAAPRIDKIYAVVQKLFQRSELFHSLQAPEETERLREQIRGAQEHYRGMEAALKALKGEDAEKSRELASLRDRIHTLRSELDKALMICTRLEEEEPEEVLQGQVDFGRAEDLVQRIKALDEMREKAQGSLYRGERKNGELRSQYRTQTEALARLRQDLSRMGREHQSALQQWKQFYPREEPQCILGVRAEERERSRAMWESRLQELQSRLSEVCSRYDLKTPESELCETAVFQLLGLLLPPGVALDQLEEQYLRLQQELQRIEYKIKSHVEEVRSSVEAEIRHLRMHLARVNRILSSLHFGQIKRIYLELEELPAYQALKKLESLLRSIRGEEMVSLKEFVQKVRTFIQSESNTTLSEEQIADYRSYIRIRRVIVDRDDRVRETGLSSGEALGVNLALCLAILFYLGREQETDSSRGMLILALDEAERLDAKALGTIRSLLDDVRCQLAVAMPRPVDISDSICHLLTSLNEGVTHIHLYHKGANGNGNGTRT